MARKSERIGAQHVSLKMVLKEKIAEKRKQEWLKREEQKALDNENGEDIESAEEEEEEILDDEEMSEEDSEEEEDEEINWEDEEARLREIDRRNKRKRIKQGSFLDDEAEDEDDIEDELNDSLDETPRTERSLICNESEFAKEKFIKDNKTDEVVSDVLARSISLPDTEELFISDKLNQKSSVTLDNNSIKDTPIHPMFSKASTTKIKQSGIPDQDKTQSTPVPDPEENTQSNQNINWTPLLSNEGSLSMLDKINSSIDEGSMSARKKLGFEELFDTTDPKVDDMDDVIGLCSGQFMTQPTNYNLPQNTNFNYILQSQDTNPRDKPQSTPTQELCDTPDTVILTENLTDIINTGDHLIPKNITDNDSAKSQFDEVEPNGNTIGNDDYQPGFMEDNTGVNDLLSSSEDENNETAEDKKLRKKIRKKKRKRLVLSDDDSDSNNAQKSISDDENKDYQEKEIYYDSEENEIESVDLDMEEKDPFKGFKSKKGALRREFVEQEAELSGDSNDELNISEDEDERGLDKLMLEEGDMDEECADEDKLRDQVGRLHQRAVLDDDQREIRLFQEAFLEDGELHSDNTRTRKFRWKDTEDDTELERRASDDEGEDIPGANVQDEKWRVERLEREKWVKESEIGKINKTKIKEDLGAEVYNDGDSDNDDSQFFSLATKALKKLNRSNSSVVHAPTPTSVSGGGGDTLISIANDIRDHNSAASKEFKSPKGRLPLQIVSSNPVGSVRGSFLSRCSSQLEKLAEMTKSSSENRTGTGAKKSRNFVFAVLSPEKSKNTKDTEPMPTTSAMPEKLKSKSKGVGKPDSKKIKIDRSIDENSSDTIFGHMGKLN